MEDRVGPGREDRRRDASSPAPLVSPLLCRSPSISTALREDGLDRVAALKARVAALRKTREDARAAKIAGKGKAAATPADSA